MTVPMAFEAQQQLQSELASGERLLWTGQPRQGIRLRAADALLIPFSLLWGGFAVYWEIGVLQDGTAPFMAIFGIPFVCVGLYVTVGRFLVDSYRRARTYYGLTGQRALIRTPGGIRSVALRGVADVSLREATDGTGTISFGSGNGPQLSFLVGTSWPGATRGLPPQFDMIENARRVYSQIRDAQSALEKVGA